MKIILSASEEDLVIKAIEVAFRPIRHSENNLILLSIVCASYHMGTDLYVTMLVLSVNTYYRKNLKSTDDVYKICWSYKLANHTCCDTKYKKVWGGS